MAAAVMLPLDATPSRPFTPPSENTFPEYSLNSSSQSYTSNETNVVAIPNTHISFTSIGSSHAARSIPSPPSSPPKDYEVSSASVLHPLAAHQKVSGAIAPIYSISAATLAEAVEQTATRPLPDPQHVFPWIHGLHADNQFQLNFFVQKRKHLRSTPKGLRELTIVKAGDDLTCAKLKGAILPDELLTIPKRRDGRREFIEIDPRTGFSVRNFQIQACKMATVSDIVVYGDDETPRREVEKLARVLSQAQKAYSEKTRHEAGSTFNTFIVTDSFSTFEKDHSSLVAITADGTTTGEVIDFPFQERVEMHSMSASSEIAHNVWLGPTPDVATFGYEVLVNELARFNILIEGSDYAQIPGTSALADVENFLSENNGERAVTQLDFPASGSLTACPLSWHDADGIMRTLHWIHKMANQKGGSRESKILLHCTDGYTESSLLAIAYVMFAECIPVHEAWIRLHCQKKRNFFAYGSDKAILEALEHRILQESPKSDSAPVTAARPQWMTQMDGSLPSRILPFLYLGNIGHASNPGLLKRLGITRVLSVGEPLTWSKEDRESWGEENFMYIDKVQDNGIDSLTNEFERCLAFIDEAKHAGHATLVHCRVGVSRSATICIAAVMREKGLSFPRAYSFVRARRLNVIIQPHLRFVYELLKWEEDLCQARGAPIRRELEWATVAREIALMNKPYCRG